MNIDFFSGTPSSEIINIIILSLFFIGFLLVRRSKKIIKRENKALDNLQMLFKNAIQQEETVEDVLKMDEFNHYASITDAVKSANNFSENPELMDECVKNACPSRTSWGKYIAGILIIFGLIGTIVGLSEAILEMQNILSGMGNNVTRNTFQEIIAKILKSLDFMETAFSTTLCGFIFFIVLSFIDHLYQTSYDKFSKKLDQFVSNLMIPYFTPKKEESNLTEIAKTLKISVNGFIQVSENISALVAKVMDNQETFMSLGQGLQSTTIDAANSQKTLEKYYQNIEQLTQRYVNHSESLGTQIVKNQEITESLFDKLGSDKNQIEKLYTNVNSSIQKMSENFSTNLIQLRREIRNAVDVQNQKIEQIEKDHDAYARQTTLKLGKMIKTAKAVMEVQKKAHEEDLKQSEINQKKAIESSSDYHIEKMRSTIETVFKMHTDVQQKEMIMISKKITELINTVKSDQQQFMNKLLKSKKTTQAGGQNKKGFFKNLKSSFVSEKENQSLKYEDNVKDETK